ncbi:hypothetical protein CkaCkLH20_11679 [Colletotrichum karsti]|uniref:tRNA (adenine(58)-N(1))-methyltransferase catalytic subunit TRM61 n=1 Tax=Colletotrichum karsti TaxID=1095194 RepID=A0A9P6LFP2_9PEZI|nr:uncharacterized protein CkaCkLH20_11679 [Colletotrichum karsti]KAF9870780.1 hypothetical protein CkaCkLH20_11679 [Colletotrichum karsti]
MIQDVRGLASLAKMNRRLNAITTRPLYKQTINHNSNKTLLWASATGQIGTLDLLARNGQNIHVIVRGPHKSGHPRRAAYRSALDDAARHGQTRAAAWLLRRGADTNKHLVLCPLKTALLHEKYDVAHVLLSRWSSCSEAYWEVLWSLDGATVWQKALEADDVSAALGFPACVVADYISVILNGEAIAITEEERLIDAVGILLDPVEIVDAYRSQRRDTIPTRTPFDDTPEGEGKHKKRQQSEVTMAVFPNEILIYISREVDNIADLAALARTNYFLNVVTTPLLYQMEIRNGTKKGDHRLPVWAASKGYLRVLQLLKQHGLGSKDLNACRIHIRLNPRDGRDGRDYHIFKRIYGEDRAVNKFHGKKSAPIHHAALKGHTKVVEWLIQQGASMSKTSIGIIEWPVSNGLHWLWVPMAAMSPFTAMTLALAFKQYNVAQLLANNGAHVDRSYWLEDGCSIWEQALHDDYATPALTFASSTRRQRQMLDAEESAADTAEALIDPILALDAYHTRMGKRFSEQARMQSAVSTAREWIGRACQAWGTKGCRGHELNTSTTPTTTAAMTMATLEDLPSELLLHIAEELWELRGLASLAKMNHRLKAIANPILYQAAARKKKHNAFFHCARIGQMGNLEILRKNGQDLRVSISNSKELLKKAKHALKEKSRLGSEKAKKLREMGQKTDSDSSDDDDDEATSNGDFLTSTQHGMEKVYTGELFKNPNVREMNAISIAAVHGQAEVISWLISHGVSINIWSVNLCPCQGHDEEGAHNIAQTPLHLAICHGQFGAAHVLTANGASPECTDTDGTSMWQGAISSSQPAPALRFAASVAEAQASVAASFSPVDSIFADVTHHSGCIPTSVDDTHQFACIPTKETEAATQDASARNPTSIFGGESFGESSPTAGDPEILQPIQPTEDQTIDAVYTMLDPIAAIGAYSNSRQTEVKRWHGRKLELMAAHKCKIVKRADRRVRRKQNLLERMQWEAEKEAREQWRQTNYSLDVILGKMCRGWKSKKFHHQHDVIVLRQRGTREAKFHLSPPLRHDTPIKLNYGAKVNGSDIIGKTFTDSITDTDGRDVKLQEVTLAQYVTNSARVATPIYPQDAHTIISFLDINLPVPGEEEEYDDASLKPRPFEIFEAGTGMGALTLHLARAIHGANPPVPPNIREWLSTAPYEKNTLPRKVVTDADGLEYADAPHALELTDSTIESQHKVHTESRRAVIHTLDVNPTSSRMAHGLVRNFRRGRYLLDVDFHVSTIRSYLSSRLAESEGRSFLAHAILDLPASQDHADVVVDALLPGGKLVVFYPSITQVLEFVVWAKESGQPVTLDRVVELQTSTSLGDVGFRDGLGGRHWDVKVVDIRKAAKAGTKGVVCRPKVGSMVVGGGFVAVFSRMPNAVPAKDVVEQVEQSEAEDEVEDEVEGETQPEFETEVTSEDGAHTPMP